MSEVGAAQGALAPDEKLKKSLIDAFQPTRLEITDDSHQHAGHQGAKEGKHFSVLIVAPCFAGQTTVQRHRMIYAAVGDLKTAGIHALAIDARPA